MKPINLLDLYASVILDTSGYDEGLDNALESASSFGDKLKQGLATAAKVGGIALTAAAAGVTALTKASIENYAEYEQLVGGVETLFGTGSHTIQEYAAAQGKSIDEVKQQWLELTTGQRIVMNNAENAFKTAGLSANEYMETVTSFSAALIQSLDGDTKKAANVADMAITDMADNANKMGSSIETIQNAYQGFAKQNYTMLDNLKLGYGGTKEEMQRLLDDAERISGIEYDISSFADITEAIHVMQEEMGIAGTTAAEASKTISGSIAAMKAQWQNLLTVISAGDEEMDVNVYATEFIETVKTVASNILPVIETALSGIVTLITSLAPQITDMLSSLAPTILPSLLTAAASILTTLVTEIVPIFVGLLPMLINDVLPSLIDAAVTLVIAIVNDLPTIIKALVDAAPTVIQKLAEGLIQAAPVLLTAIPEIIFTLVEGFIDSLPEIINVGKDLVRGIWEGISAMGRWIRDNVRDFFGGIVDGVKDLLGIHSPSTVFAEMGKNMALGVGEGWDKSFSDIKAGIEDGMNFEGDYSVNATSTSAGMTGGASFGTVNININGANYSDERALAEAIGYELQRMTERRLAVFA